SAGPAPWGRSGTRGSDDRHTTTCSRPSARSRCTRLCAGLDSPTEKPPQRSSPLRSAAVTSRYPNTSRPETTIVWSAVTISHKSPNKVSALVNYTTPTTETPRYHATDPSRDVHVLDPHTVKIIESRSQAELPRLDREGFELVDHRTKVKNFLDPAEVER